MRGVNKAILIGNLGNDPEVRFTQSGDSVATLSIATDESYKDKNGQVVAKVEWHKVVMWRKLGEIAGQYLRKGSKVYIEGKLETRKWTDKEGVERYTTEINANHMLMLDSRDNGQQSSQQARPANQPPPPPANQPMGVSQAGGADFEDDIPFMQFERGAI